MASVHKNCKMRPHHPSMLRTQNSLCSLFSVDHNIIIIIHHSSYFFVTRYSYNPSPIFSKFRGNITIMGTQSTMKRLSRAKLLLLLAAPTDGYIIPTHDARSFSNDHSVISNGRINDRTDIGTLSVPSVGIGTIAWSSDSCK